MIVNKQIIIREFGKIREGRRGGRQTERGVPERERQAGEATLVRVFSRGGRKTPALSGIAEGNAPKSTATGTARFTKSSRRIPIRGHSSDPMVRSTLATSISRIAAEGRLLRANERAAVAGSVLPGAILGCEEGNLLGWRIAQGRRTSDLRRRKDGGRDHTRTSRLNPQGGIGTPRIRKEESECGEGREMMANWQCRILRVNVVES